MWANTAVEIVVQVKDEVARALHRDELRTPAAQALLATAADLSVSLVPIHPATDHPALLSYFRVDAPDTGSALEILKELERSDAVTAAYVKPPAEPA